MRKVLPRLAALCIGLALVFGGRTTALGEQFYQGKTARILVPYPPGGGYDIHSRLLARHLRRHIPGNPNVIVQNMPGGGGLIAPNYLYHVAKPDGLTISILGASIYADQLAGTEGVKFDLKKFSWIGTTTSEVAVGMMRSDSPYQSVEAIRRAARPPVIGFTGTGSSYYQFTSLLNHTLGLNIRLVGGYLGTAPIKVAVKQGELDGIVGMQYSSALSSVGDWVREGYLTFFIQSGVWDPRTSSFHRHFLLKDVPTVSELANPEHKRIIILVNAAQVLGRPFIAPPGVPEDRVKMLRDAFAATVNSAEYKTEAKRIFGMDLEPGRGEALQEFVAEVMAAPAEQIALLKKLLKR